MTEYLKVKDYPHLVRDLSSRAIVNTDVSAYETAVARAKARKEQRDELRDAVRDINNLKCEMHEIKNLLLKIVDKS
jgi:hypothetical protein